MRLWDAKFRRLRSLRIGNPALTNGASDPPPRGGSVPLFPIWTEQHSTGGYNTTVGRQKEFDTELVLEEAMKVFWRKGYDGASITDLTDAMGIARPSLYSTFG